MTSSRAGSIMLRLALMMGLPGALNFVLALPSFAQAPQDAASFLAEMPAPDQVVQKIQGTDPLDTKLRQWAAFRVLTEDLMQAQRGPGRAAPPPQFGAIANGYMERARAIQTELRAQLLGAGQPTVEQSAAWKQAFEKMNAYRFSKEFQQDLLGRFFSPAWVAAYQQKKSDRATAAAEGRTALQEGSDPTPATPAERVGPPFPEQAKARAAGVDMTVFGVELGEPLRLPACVSPKGAKPDPFTMIDPGVGTVRTLCRGSSITGVLLGANTAVHMPKCPNWVLGDAMKESCSMQAYLHDGRLSAVAITTRGVDVAPDVEKVLVAKYGAPSRKTPRRMQNRYGATFDLLDLEWSLPGLHVLYTPMGTAPGAGMVMIRTETAVKSAQARERAQRAGEAKF